MKELNQLLKFEPILKEKIWGGEKLKDLFRKKTKLKNIGESWEISDVDKDISIVSNRNLKGQSLQQLIATFKGELVGEKVYQQFGEKFPLLIKFIDAKEALSIQLHPNDELAKKRHNSFGKTEMWYVLQADENANLIVGFKEDCTSEKYVENLENKTLLDILNVDKVANGDVYFIETGTVHAIGAGVLLAEIQQTSDITYRIYDWNRQDSNGDYRDLHIDDALDAIDYKAKETYKTDYTKQKNKSSEIVSCPYFTANIVLVDGQVAINHQEKDSFVIYMCVAGEVVFSYLNQKETLKTGQTLLVPACINQLKISSKETSELLEVYIK